MQASHLMTGNFLYYCTMLIYLTVSFIARIFMPHDAVLVNQKLKGFWVVVEDNRAVASDDSLMVVRFNKCKSAKRKEQQCVYNWTVLDSTAVIKNKLDKDIKENWTSDVTKTYWVEKKKDKETKREIIHIEGFDEISINLAKKEIEFYKGDSMLIKIRKLK